MIVLYHRLAVQDGRSARRYYSRISVTLAEGFLSAIDEAIRRIESNPHIGSPVFTDFRWVPLRRFPYLIYYEITPAVTIRIFAISHKSRRPGYWLGRRTRA